MSTGSGDVSVHHSSVTHPCRPAPGRTGVLLGKESWAALSDRGNAHVRGWGHPYALLSPAGYPEIVRSRGVARPKARQHAAIGGRARADPLVAQDLDRADVDPFGGVCLDEQS